MKTIFIAAYISGIVYQLLCTDIIKMFANGSRETFEECMEKFPIPDSIVKIVKLITNLIMFVAMIITVMLWPIGKVYNLYLRVIERYWKF